MFQRRFLLLSLLIILLLNVSCDSTQLTPTPTPTATNTPFVPATVTQNEVEATPDGYPLKAKQRIK